ncbi:valine--tRNA ligase [Entomobacter blattae]|uniref:Valine--tRNA ligase n=1 Tax=Entomobacter blattae TaxID=2762277 RepID=A0A7H1NT48_9PROT|nr:valine--tRNA ligase [Entomobacter blattae]QNT78958.1 Valine--tRNA ligase [Entomobacter blattae]
MLEKTFSPQEVEQSLYHLWEESGVFSADPGSSKPAFAIMIPPPNVTGNLHMGHALTMTLQDILVRWRRMQGYDVLWQPGTDHAGIATQLVVERELRSEKLSREGLGREKFTERVWQWKNNSGGQITQQLRRLGASLDWKRERFTMDEGLSVAVRKVFVTLYRDGLIYRDNRLVNWDPVFRSALSDLEVVNKEIKGHLWYIRYPVAEEEGQFITIATTRPETMLGDVAIAVHPEDDRYTTLIGQSAIVPLTGRRVPIVADEYSDPEKGTGAVKITPAHDFNDFEVGKRHNLPLYTVLDEEAHIILTEIEEQLTNVSGLADKEFVYSLKGLSREKARAAIVEELERLSLLDKVESHIHQVPHADRGGAIVEPRLTLQWYCDAPHLAKAAIKAVKKKEAAFIPEQWENTFFAWMNNIQPWCISRQLWWGHQIPAWYGPDGHVFVAFDEEEAKKQAFAHYKNEKILTRDEDVLDTWFSSALWPFSTLGWPEETEELKKYYPGSVLVTGFDIIFFWVARMIMMGEYFIKDVPFKKIYIHGLVRDEHGQKMSKSKGNGIDPLLLIDKYGADVVRFTVSISTGIGRDVRLGEKRVEEFRGFVTKLWNAARFCEMNGITAHQEFSAHQGIHPLALWIMEEAQVTLTEVTTALEAFRFDDYAQACYRFVWNRFCDWFLELAKPWFLEGDTPAARELKECCGAILGFILKILHPVMPFVTEELWHHFGYGPRGSLIRAEWPRPSSMAESQKKDIDWLISLISEIRTIRAEMNIPPAQKMPVYVMEMNSAHRAIAKDWGEALSRMARVSEFHELEGNIPDESAQTVLQEATLIFPLSGVVDIVAEKKRLGKEISRLGNELAKVEAKLANKDFISRAKPEVVEENRQRLFTFQNEIKRFEAALARLA